MGEKAGQNSRGGKGDRVEYSESEEVSPCNESAKECNGSGNECRDP